MTVIIPAIITVVLQTATPTPEPTGVFSFPPLEFKHPDIPTTIPTSTPYIAPTDVYRSEIYNMLATSERGIVAAPESIGGSSLPSETGILLFSYTKWLFSPNITRELFGVFSPIPDSIGIVLAISLIAISAFFTLLAIVISLRAVIWLIKFVRSMLPLGVLPLMLFAVVPPTPTPFPTPNPSDYFFTPFESTSEITWGMTGDSVQSWHMLPDGVTGLLQGLMLVIIMFTFVRMIILWVRGMVETVKDD